MIIAHDNGDGISTGEDAYRSRQDMYIYEDGNGYGDGVLDDIASFGDCTGNGYGDGGYYIDDEQYVD